MRLRQIALVAHELEPAITGLCSTLGVEECFRDPGVGVFGLHNALVVTGDTFVEVVSPTAEGTTAGRYLERRGGDGGYMVLLDMTAVERVDVRQRAGNMGIREVFQAEDTHGSSHIIGTHFHPGDTGGAILSVDTPTPAGTWGWAGDRWNDIAPSTTSGRLVGVEIQSDRADELTERWSQLLGVPATGHTLSMEESTISFVAPSNDRGEGICHFTVEAADPAKRGTSVSVNGVSIGWV